jgi:hypothetical protein
MTVSCRRSAVSWRRSALATPAGSGRVAPACDGGGGVASFAPQALQKLEPGTLSCRQAGQTIPCGAPQWLQNRLSADKFAPQLRQAMAKGLL